MKGPKKLTIKSWAESDRPREKLMLLGRRVLSDAELLAVLIGSGSREHTAVDLCRQILHECEYDLEKLAALPVKDLCRFKGIGEAKAVTIISALELCYRRSAGDRSRQMVRVRCSRDSFSLMNRYFAGLKQEEFWIILLNRAGRLICKNQVSVGTLGETPVDPKVIFPVVLQHRASSIVLCHNHPSGDLKPSKQDIYLTRQLSAASNLLGISVSDHLIFGTNQYFSFADHDLMP